MLEMLEMLKSNDGKTLRINLLANNLENLLDAKKFPKKYPDLIIMVETIPFRFVKLPKKLQTKIINASKDLKKL